MPVTQTLHEDKFFTKIDGRRFATPLSLILILIESCQSGKVKGMFFASISLDILIKTQGIFAGNQCKSDIEQYSGAMFGRHEDPILSNPVLLDKSYVRQVIEESE